MAPRRAPLNPALRRALRWGSMLLLPAAWFLLLRLGPGLASKEGPAPACFPFHAKGLLMAQLGYPRTLEARLAPPAPGSNEEAQLRLMGFWSGREWTAKARGYGRVEGPALQLLAGRLVLDEVVAVTPPRTYDGRTLGQVDYRVRWDYRGELDEFTRVKDLVPYQLPRNLGIPKPGGVAVRQATLARQGLGWTVQDAAELRLREPGLPSPNYRILSFFL
ncbi:MAG: hypothetical protein U0P81_01210 [Holophagaceae bacterium]